MALALTTMLSWLPRTWLQNALWEQWSRTLTVGEQACLDRYGATGNADHHDYQWADDLVTAE